MLGEVEGTASRGGSETGAGRVAQRTQRLWRTRRWAGMDASRLSARLNCDLQREGGDGDGNDLRRLFLSP